MSAREGATISQRQMVKTMGGGAVAILLAFCAQARAHVCASG